MTGGAARYRILLLTAQTPDRARQGGAIRNWNIMARLAARHDLDLLTFRDDDPGGQPAVGDEAAPWQTIDTVPAPRRDWRRRLRVLALTSRPDMADRLWSPRFAQRLDALLRERHYDIVQAGGIEMARYLLTIQAPPERRPLLVFDDYNAEYVLQRRAATTDLRRPPRWHAAAYSVAQWRRLRHFERRLLRAADLTVCVSEADAEALQPLAPERPLLIAPNGVDTTFYSPGAVASTTPLPRFTLVFSGTLDFRPNVDAATWFVTQVWPRLRQRRPDARLALVGRSPTPDVTRLVRHGGVTVTGSVADDRPYFLGATVFVLPMRYGGGIRLKLLNALALGCAVVSTTAGAEGVAVRDSEHLLLADSAEDFAAAVERLLDDAPLRARLGVAGRAFVQRHFAWDAIVARLESGYAAILQGRPQGPSTTSAPDNSLR